MSVKWQFSWTAKYTLLQQKCDLHVDGNDYERLFKAATEKKKHTNTMVV